MTKINRDYDAHDLILVRDRIKALKERLGPAGVVKMLEDYQALQKECRVLVDAIKTELDNCPENNTVHGAPCDLLGHRLMKEALASCPLAVALAEKDEK